MHATHARLLLALIVAVTAAGCSTTGGDSQVRNTIFDTHRRVAKLDSSLEGSVNKLNETSAELLARVNESEQQTRSVQSLIEENQFKLDALERKLAELQSAVYKALGLSQPVGPSPGIGGDSEISADMGQQVEVIPPWGSSAPATPDGLEPIAKTTPPGLPSGAETAPVSAASSNLEADYQQAQISYKNEDFTAALAQFSDYLERYPNSENCPNAQYWKAKSLQSLERYEEAITEFEKLRSQYATSIKVPYAMHQQAVCHHRIGQTQRALDLMQSVIRDYPMTPAADQAKTDVKKLQGN